MAELRYKPVPHEHEQMLAKARQNPEFSAAYDRLELEYQLANEMLKARSRAKLTQDAVARRMGTTKSAVSRLEAAKPHVPSLDSLQRYARAVGCEVRVRFIRQKRRGGG